MANIVFIDNFDSFTYNLVDQFRSLGHDVTIYRNSLSASTIETAVEKLDNPVLLLSWTRSAIRSRLNARSDQQPQR